MTTLKITETVLLKDVLDTASQLSFNPEQTLNLLWGALDLARQKPRRVFSYSRSFAAAHPSCVSDFVRSFQHADWIDGESVVQAETNSLEEGFNSRFHKIEADLDALSANLARAFVCLADQRSELATLLDELRSEINRIHSDVHDCCSAPPAQPPTSTLPTWPVWPIDPFPPIGPRPTPPITTLPPGLGWPGPPIWPGVSNPPWLPNGPLPRPDLINPGGGRPWLPTNVDPVRNYLDSVTGINSFSAQSTQVLRAGNDPSVGIVAGMQARVIEKTLFNGTPMEVWSTPLGLIMTHAPAGSLDETARPGWTHPGLEVNERYARWATDNEARVRETLGREFDLGSFVKAFGDERLDGGLRLGDLMGGLASDLRTPSALGLLPALAESTAKAIVREGTASEAVIGAIGLNKQLDKGVLEAPPSAIKGLSPETASALDRAGVRTLGELANAPAAELSSKLRDIGANVPLPEVVALQAKVAGLGALDRLARGLGPR